MRKIDYQNNIINIPASILKWATLTPDHEPLSTLDQHLTDTVNHVVLVLLDGFGANLMKKLNDEALLKVSQVKTLDSVFPPTTAAATTSVLTGKTPYETGFLGWFQYFKDYDTYYTIFMESDYYQSDKPIDPFFKTAFNRKTFIDRINHESPILGKIFFPHPIDKEGYPSLAHGFSEVSKFTKSHAKTVSYIYAVEPDLTQHKFGVHSQDTLDKISELNTLVEAFKETLSQDTLVIMTADHGLTDVTAVDINQDKELMAFLKAKPSVEPRATNFHVKEGLLDAFKAYFLAHYQADFYLLDQATFLKEGYLGFGEKHAYIDHCLGDFIAIAKSDKYFDLTSEGKHKAHHAGLKEDELRVPLVIFKGGL
jgi:predicted AlkP superfamily pyrophosphatase or phosphodiesterase